MNEPKTMWAVWSEDCNSWVTLEETEDEATAWIEYFWDEKDQTTVHKVTVTPANPQGDPTCHQNSPKKNT